MPPTAPVSSRQGLQLVSIHCISPDGLMMRVGGSFTAFSMASGDKAWARGAAASPNRSTTL